jgi:NAD(P)-dependent dehydrogenase (short-subunit alcohol dehydrogenase family)
MSFEGKVVIITGASSGIGAQSARDFAKLGAKVTLVGRNLENLQQVAADCGSSENVLTIQADVTVEVDAKKIIDQTIKKFSQLDVLLNNAGIIENGSIENTSIEQYDRVMNTNMRSIYYLTMLAVPHLIKTQGNIVNISSVCGIRSFPGVLAYNISKAAVDQFTRCVALELAPKNVRVNSVAPGKLLMFEIFFENYSTSS